MSEERNAYMREWKRNNPEKVNAINRRVKAKNPELYKRINRESATRVREAFPEKAITARQRYRDKDPVRYLWLHARARAKRTGVDFDLTHEDIVVPTICPVLGIPLAFSIGQRASANHGSPSLDRMDNSKGYVRGNVHVISNRANHLKNNATLAEIEKIAAYMRAHS